MKIAVPSDNNKTLSQHFGRCAGFIIFDVAEGGILSSEYRFNTFTHHVTGQQHQYGPHPGHGQGHDHVTEEAHHTSHGNHSHARILDALQDCDIIIAGGMGYRLQEDLAGAGKKVHITRLINAREAVEMFLQDRLVSDKEACRHH